MDPNPYHYCYYYHYINTYFIIIILYSNIFNTIHSYYLQLINFFLLSKSSPLSLSLSTLLSISLSLSFSFSTILLMFIYIFFLFPYLLVCQSDFPEGAFTQFLRHSVQLRQLRGVIAVVVLQAVVEHKYWEDENPNSCF